MIDGIEKIDLHVDQPDAKCIKFLNIYVTKNINVQKLTSKENFLRCWNWLSEAATTVQLNKHFTED